MITLQTFDSQGLSHVTNQGIIELAYQKKLDHSLFEWQDQTAKAHYAKVCEYLDYWPMRLDTPDVLDRQWFTPEDYQHLDLDAYVLSRCKNDQQITRAQLELKIIHELGVAHIFKHLIYLVTQWRSQNLVWGVGRGSSVSCFVLYAIGLNKINPLDYDLDHGEFFKTAGHTS